jgi:hypothetical protein
MAQNGMTFSQAQFFDGTAGFLTIATSGNTGSTGNAILRLTSVEVNQTNNTIDLQAFDNDFQIDRAITTQSFEVSAEGYFTGTGTTGNLYSGNTTYVTGKYTGEDLLDLALERRSDLTIYVKLGGKIKKGRVVIASYSVSSSVGEVQTFSLSLSGSGGLEAV